MNDQEKGRQEGIALLITASRVKMGPRVVIGTVSESFLQHVLHPICFFGTDHGAPGLDVEIRQKLHRAA